MPSYNSGALSTEDVEALRICAGMSFDRPVQMPSGLIMSGEEATVLAAALVEESLIQEPSGVLRCAECNTGLRIGLNQLLCHQDGTPICKTPERIAWLSARHMLAIEAYQERQRQPRGAGTFWLLLGITGPLLGALIWAVEVINR